MSPRMIRHPIILVCAAFLGASAPLFAGDAVFSADGRKVYSIDPSSEALEMVGIPDGVTTTVNPDGVDGIDSICRADGENLYLISENALWKWKPGDAGVTLAGRAKEGEIWREISSDKDGGRLVIFGEAMEDGHPESFIFYRPDKDTEFIPFRPRHVANAQLGSPLFLQDGSLLFSADGDLWHGFITYESIDGGSGKDERIGSLTAYRYAPLAERFAYPGTSSQQGVGDIALGAGKVFVHVSRIGGTGWGHVSSLAPPPLQSPENFEPKNEVKDSIKVLQSVRLCHETGGGRTGLCASPDGKTVHMTTGSSSGESERLLVKAGVAKGEPVPIGKKN